MSDQISLSSKQPLHHRKWIFCLGGVLLLLLLLCLTCGSIIFRHAASFLAGNQGYLLKCHGNALRPLGFFAFSAWELYKNDKLIICGTRLSGTYRLTPGGRFRLNLQGNDLSSGAAFPDLFPAHNEKIPSIELHDFQFQARGKGFSESALRTTLVSEFEMNIRKISLESSGLCRKVYDNTGVRLARYLQFSSGHLKISQKQNHLTLLSTQELTGPYQILSLDGETDLEKQTINLKLIFGLQPELIRKIRHRHFLRYLIPEDWDEQSAIFLPAPVLLSGTLRHPRIDVGDLFRRNVAGDGRQRIQIKLKKNRGSKNYHIQRPPESPKQEQNL